MEGFPEELTSNDIICSNYNLTTAEEKSFSNHKNSLSNNTKK